MAISKKPFLPNLNVIRSQKQAGGYEVAESLDAISTAIEGLHVISSGLSQQVAAVRGSVGEVQTQVVKVVGAAAAAAGSQVPFQPVSVTANAVIGIIDLGSESGPVVRVFDATAQVNVPWAGPNSIVVCSNYGLATSSHGAQDGLIEGLIFQAEDFVNGVGFTLHVYSPLGSWGKYAVACVNAASGS